MIPERLAELALALELTAVTDPAGVGVARLLGELARRDRWLLVFDNAEDPRALSRLLPEGPGQVLITSRNPAWRGIAATRGGAGVHPGRVDRAAAPAGPRAHRSRGGPDRRRGR